MASRRSVRSPDAPRALVPRATFRLSERVRTAGDRCASRRPRHLRHPCGSVGRSCDHPADPWFAIRPRGRSAPAGGGPPTGRPSGLLRRVAGSGLSTLPGAGILPGQVTLRPLCPSGSPPATVPLGWCRHLPSGPGASSGLSVRPSSRSERSGMYRRVVQGSSRHRRRSFHISAGQALGRKSDKKRRVGLQGCTGSYADRSSR